MTKEPESTTQGRNGSPGTARLPAHPISRSWVHPTGGSPKVVTILALGPTQSDYHADAFSYTPQARGSDEIWTVNKGFRSLRNNFVFILDDLIGERLRSEVYYQDIINTLQETPVITSIIDREVRAQYAQLKNLSEYPLLELLDFYGYWVLQQIWRDQGAYSPYTLRKIREEGLRTAGYLKNSIPMMLAYAAFIGVREVHLWGADYDYPGFAIHEKDKPNTEYWIGLLYGLCGMRVRMSSKTTLLSTNQGRDVYGYGVRQPRVHLPGDDPAYDREFINRDLPAGPTTSPQPPAAEDTPNDRDYWPSSVIAGPTVQLGGA